MNTQASNAATARRWSLGLVLALAVNLALWTIAGVALSTAGLPQSASPGLDGFGLLQWKVS